MKLENVTISIYDPIGVSASDRALATSLQLCRWLYYCRSMEVSQFDTKSSRFVLNFNVFKQKQD